MCMEEEAEVHRVRDMKNETALLWWWLNILDFRRYNALKERFGDLDEARKAMSPALLRDLRLKEETVAGVLERLGAFKPERYLFEMARRKIHFLTIEDERYPASLKAIGDPPVFLSAIGNFDALKLPMLAIVGTRAMSRYGQRITETFVPVLSRSGLTTVSGLALGVDAEVAKQTLEAGGMTVAVLGHGLARIYPPANTKLSEEIVQKGGLLLSEFPLEVPPDKYTFPARNRIIAGLSMATVLCEAPEGSGSIITAELALEYGRDVFAVPGQIFDPNFAGKHRLIATGQARLAQSPDDILLELGFVTGGRTTGRRDYVPQTDDEDRVYHLLTAMPRSLDELVEESELGISQVGVALTMMELAGAARSVEGGQWIRT